MQAIAVHRARVPRGYGTRDEVERWFRRIPVEQLGLREREIFYVPRLHLRLRGPPGAHDGRIPAILLAELRALLASAGRGDDRSFASGRAYVFASRGSYHAWLVRLRIGDRPAQAREAFRAATGHSSLASWQRSAVLPAGPELVAAIARLAEQGDAARWIASFEAADFALAERAIRAAFAIPLGGGTEAPEPAGSSPTDPLLPPERLLYEAARALTARGNDWPGLSRRGRALLIAAVLLARRPARSPAQAALLGRQLAMFAAKADASATAPTPAPAVPDPAARLVRPGAVPSRPAILARPPPSSSRSLPRRAAVGRSTDPADRALSAPPHFHVQPLTQADTGAPAETVGRAAEQHPPSFEPFLAPDLRFETGFGGLLFLVNAVVALGLYPDFTQPLGRRLDPSPLWLLDRIGRYRFGDRYRRDPLSRWIAGHAAPGRLPRRWKAEEAWLAGFPPTRESRLSLRSGRATLWHPAGFPLRDVPARARPRRAIRILPPAYLPLGPDRWAACLALYLDARLRLAAREGLALLALPATVEVRDLEILAGFRLDSHPIALRMAGLDRDPGWQPAEGRSFAFSFR